MESQELNCRKCNSCGFLTLSATHHCPNCSSINWVNLSLTGFGRIYSFSKINIGFGRMSTKTPYYLAMIQLDEGLNILATIDYSFNESIDFNAKVKFSNLTEENTYTFNIIE